MLVLFIVNKWKESKAHQHLSGRIYINICPTASSWVCVKTTPTHTNCYDIGNQNRKPRSHWPREGVFTQTIDQPVG